MTESPRLLFVPASGSQGTGEYYRSLAIAQGARARWPQAAIRFVVNRQAGYADKVPFESVAVDGSPTFNTGVVNHSIEVHRPHVVIFDSAGRVAQLAYARRRGAATVYVSSRMKTRWKGFRLRRMRYLAQHWLAWPRFVEGDLSSWERMKLALMHGPEIVFLDPVRPALDTTRAAALRLQYGLTERNYLLISSGGGGYLRKGMPAPEIFGRAALEVRRASDRRIVWVKGPNYAGSALGEQGIVEFDTLLPEQMIDLLAGAEIAMISGGSLLLQALGVNTAAVAAPVAGDQPQRIAACVNRGLAVAAALTPQALATTTLELLNDQARCAALRSRINALRIGNGVDQAVAALATLLARVQKSA